jgi:hypothetical protein
LCNNTTANDGKANIEVLKANLDANIEEIKKLRDDNKDYRQKYAMLQRVSAYREQYWSGGHSDISYAYRPPLTTVGTTSNDTSNWR